MMTRLLLAVALLAIAVPVSAQTDVGVQTFACRPPNAGTRCFRVHENATSTTAGMNVTILGDVAASGGYKVAHVFAHNGRVIVSASNVLFPIAGTSLPSPATGGPTYVPVPTAGSIIAVSISASTALTAGGAHAEAVVLRGTTTAPSGFIALLDASNSAAGPSQYNYNTQARGLDILLAGDRIGCRWSSSSDLAPLTMILSCAVTVVY